MKKLKFLPVPRVPLLFLLLFFYVCGIISSRVEGVWLPVFLLPGAVFILGEYLLNSRFKLLALSGALLIFGYGFISMNDAGTSVITESDWLNISDGKVDIQGVLVKVPEETRFGERLYLRTENVRSHGITGALSIVVRVNCYRFSSGLQYGDTVLIKNIRLRKPVNYNNPGGFDYRLYLLDRGVELTGSVSKPSRIAVLQTGSSLSIVVLLYKLKNRLKDFIEKRSTSPVSGFIETIGFGDRGAVSPELRGVFSKTGISHILAVSGLHVGFIIFMFYSIFKTLFSTLLVRLHIKSFMLGHAAKYAAAFTIPFVSAYVLMSGNSSSSFRAAVMGVVFLLSIIIGKERELFSVIALSAMVLLLDNPARLFEIGFQLSFTAIFFIVYGYRKLPTDEPSAKKTLSSKRGPGRSIVVYGKNMLLVSCLAGIGTAPLTAYYFNIVSVISPLSNFIILPLVAVIVPSSLLFSLFSLFWESGAAVLFIIPVKLSAAVLLAADAVSGIPYGFFRVSAMEPRTVLLLYIFILSAVSLLKNGGKGKPARYIFFAAGIFLVSILFFQKETLKKGSLSVTYLDVGQGNSALIETPAGRHMLVDGGRAFGDFDIGRIVVAPFLWRKGIKTLDYVIGTHQDADHIGGLDFILREFDVKEYIDNGDNNENMSIRILETLRKKNIPHRVAVKGDLLHLSPDINVYFLNPDKTVSENRSDNDKGLVIRLSFKSVSLLFNGDITSRVEKNLVRAGGIQSSVMDAPHHGSRFSSSESYIRAVSPEVVIISVGRNNPFGHPSREVLDKYLGIGAKVLRTDLNGAVIFESDGKDYSVRPTVKIPVF